MPTTFTEFIVSCVLCAWFLASLLNQFPLHWWARIAVYDRFSLLPLWTFFAPNPGQSDYHLVYRDCLANGALGNWCEIEITEARRAFSFVWNPEKRSKKVLSDLVSILLTSLQANPEMEKAIVISVPYLLLLNVVCKLPKQPFAERRQFVIVETFGFMSAVQSRVLLRSDFHGLTS